MNRLRVLSYNVRSMRDDTAALGRVIRGVDADVALIQESPRFARWRSTCASLARRSGLVVVSGGRPAGSNLIMSSLAMTVISTQDIALSAQRNLHRRGAAVAVLERGGFRVAVAGIHLDLIEAPRLQHLDELAEHARRDAGAEVPLIIGGDLNAVPGSATWQRLERLGVDAFAAIGAGHGFTYSAVDPVRRIDAIFAPATLVPVAAEVLDSPDVRRASDHRPLVVEYELPG